MNKKQIQTLMVQECAKLMYYEGVSQYFDAKKIAAKRICKNRTQFYPSNGAISEAIYKLSQLDDSWDHASQLVRMRVKAIDMMKRLSSFHLRLIGSVSTGYIKKTSDIDLHVFCDHVEILHAFLDDEGILFETNEVQIMKQQKVRRFYHVYLRDEFDIELSVYPSSERRVTTRSSTDGKPIKRLSIAAVEKLLFTKNE